MKKTKDWFSCLAVLMLAATLPLLIGASEDKDWKAAQRTDTAVAYDEYLRTYPQGANARTARELAVARSRDGFQNAARRCAPPFPRMVYYTVAVTNLPAVRMSDLDTAVGEAAQCTFSRTLNYEETVWSVDGLLDARARIATFSEAKFPPRAMIDLDFILLDLEESAILGAHKKIKFCHDQSAWVDTPKKVAYQCSVPYLEVQDRYARAMAEQAKSDFILIGKVGDPDFRLDFWTKYKKMAKGDVMEQVGMAFQLHTHALNVKQNERDPKVAEEIENAAIRLSGGGKPRGGLPGMPH